MNTRTQKLRSLAIAIAIGTIAGVPGLARAADTEIYLGADALRPGARPNVMFIFDTSESMTRTDGLAESRMKRMKDAVDLVLDSVNNINAGLMRFTEPGGPVLFPVSNIDSSAEDQPDVNVRISSSADDAEELGGVMRLDSPLLELVETPVSGSEKTISMLPVNDRDDDAEHGTFGVSRRSGNMEATDNRSSFGNRMNGVIFRDLKIPSSSKISSAFVEFRSASSRAGPVTLTFFGEKDEKPNKFKSGDGPRDRTPTTATVDWSPPALTPGEFFRTPDLSAVAQEIVDLPGWSSGDDMDILFTGTPAIDDEGRRDFTTYDTTDSTSQAARITVTYGTGPGGKQKVGLRFPDVRVPQGMKIINAVIEFTPIAQSSKPKTVNVSGELAVDSAPFTTTPGDITGRSKTAPVAWTIPAWPTVDETQQTPNLRAIVQKIVANPSWCGGNAMSFFIEDAAGSDARKAFSWDGDPQKAPILRIDFDETTALGPGQGCTVVEMQRQVSSSGDDAFEDDATGSINLAGVVSILSAGRTAGWRFNDIALQPGTKILDARLFATPQSTIPFPTTVTLFGQKSADAGSFTTSLKDITKRPLTAAKVPWTTSTSVAGIEQESSNIADVVTEVLTQPGWVSGNDLALIATTSSGARVFKTFNLDPSRAARLYVKAKVFVGDGAAPALTVRQRLKDLVAELPTNNFTPLVDTLYEAALYFRGDPVDYGLTRGTKSASVRQLNRISHKNSFTGGEIEPDETVCDPANLNSPSCVDQKIVPSGTAVPTYISPISESCQANFIVLLTDGIANVNNSQDKIRAMTGDASCSGTLLDGKTSISSKEQCGLELVKYLATKDQSKPIDDVNTVKTYTIGFNIDSEWLKDVAKAGDGEHFKADTAAELASTLRDIISAILSRTTSFATPSLSVNAFNRLFHRNEVYFSLFAPDERVRWNGNVKKYQLCRGEAGDTCTAGEVLDFQEPPPGDSAGRRKGNPAIGEGQRISPTARSDWLPLASAPDGAKVLVGGAGRVLQEDVGYTGRRVFTYVGGPLPATLAIGTSNEITDTNITDVTLLGGSTDPTSPAFMTDAERRDLIDWIRGRDVDDEDRDGSKTDTRYAFGDPLHSSPVAITYGGTEANPIIKVFVGTNDGSVRMLNAYTGAEEWAFIPPSLLPNQRILRDNPRSEHIYGMDGTPTLWVNDENGDGTIDPTVDINGDGEFEFVRMFIGMRRGGAEILALDVTPAAKMTDPVSDTIDPKLMWIISGNLGGATTTPLEYARLGETWSRPRITTARVGVSDGAGSFTVSAQPVLLFAGGYDAGAQDPPTGLNPSGVGNAIYIADPSTGKRLAYITAPADLAKHTSGGTAGVGVPGMVYPIPSDLSVLDSDGDGATDRIYVGDTGGKVWRVDLDANTTTGGIKLTVGQLAAVSTPPPGKKNSRKFFYPPDVVQVRDRTSFSANGNYDLVTIVTGNRSHPLDLDVQERFYAIYDETIGRMNDGTSPGTEDGLADGYPVARSGTVGTFTTGVPIAGPTDEDSPTVAAAGDLLRINDRLDFDPVTDEGKVNLADLSSRSGYYLDLGAPAIPGEDPPEDAGEKGLASPIVIAGKVFFTTYLPGAVTAGSACSLSEGGGRLYGMDVLTGAPAYNYDESPDDTVLTASDRVYTLGGGIPSAAVPIFQPDAITLLIGGGGGATTVNPGVNLPRERTYWREER